MYNPSSYLNSGTEPSHVYTTNTSKKKGTMFKIDTGSYVFSCLFYSGAEISCMNMDTVATLGLLGKMVDSLILLQLIQLVERTWVLQETCKSLLK